MNFNIRNKFGLLPLFLLFFSGLLAGESVGIVTDRTIYIAGEFIQFSALIGTDQHEQNRSSNILYVEILNAEGEQVVGGKFFIKNQKCNGALLLNKTLRSDNYYLRGYTNSMKNQPGSFFYKRLKVVNANNKIIINEFVEKRIYGNETILQKQKSEYLRLDNTNYATRKKVTVTLNTPQLSGKYPLLSLSVVPSNSISFAENMSVDSKGFTNKEQRFVAENRGISVSGVVTDSMNNVLSNVLVNLSVLGTTKSIVAQYTNEQGRFYMAVPEEFGEVEMFISAHSNNTVKPVIHINNDFSTAPIPFKQRPFSPNSIEQKVIKELVFNVNVQEQFHTSFFYNDTPELARPIFYAQANQRIQADEYILLPQFQDYIKELMPNVIVQTSKRKKKIVIINTNNQQNIYPPLILLDGLVMSDYTALWSIPTSKIKTIESVYSEFVHGDFIYGGILHVHTKQEDFGGIELPVSGIFFDYKLLAPIIKQNAQEVAGKKNIPDARNTLLWISDVSRAKISENTLQFNTGDTYGEYWLILQGLSLSGESFQEIISFNINNGN